MTVKITQVSTLAGEATLTVAFDNPVGSGHLEVVHVKKSDLYERLKQVRELLGRPVTLQDARQALVAVVNEVRAGRSRLPEDFDFSEFVNVELERSEVGVSLDEKELEVQP